MRHLIRAIILLALLALPGWAQTPPRPQAGLLWNRSGLPATLPLQVRSMAGWDHVVTLTAADNAETIMAAYIRGGEFFRLLVPPGTWQIDFATGRSDAWQGEDRLFGAATQMTMLTDPLSFGATVARLNGHSITLQERDGRVRVAGTDRQIVCQFAGDRYDVEPLSDGIAPRDLPPQDRYFPTEEVDHGRLREDVSELLYGVPARTGRSGQAPRSGNLAPPRRERPCNPSTGD